MNHLTDINDIEKSIGSHRLCLFYIKAPDCGVCNVMLDKVRGMAENHSKLEAFYTDIIEEPLVASRFLVYSGPTVLILLDGREVYRASGFIDILELERKVDKLEEFSTYDITLKSATNSDAD